MINSDNESWIDNDKFMIAVGKFGNLRIFQPNMKMSSYQSL